LADLAYTRPEATFVAVCVVSKNVDLLSCGFGKIEFRLSIELHSRYGLFDVDLQNLNCSDYGPQ